MPSISPIIDAVGGVGGRERRFMIVNVIGLKRFYPQNPNTHSYMSELLMKGTFLVN